MKSVDGYRIEDINIVCTLLTSSSNKLIKIIINNCGGGFCFLV